MKDIIKKIVPPIIFDLFRPAKKYGFFGDYQSWAEALKDSKGYDAPDILEKVKNSLLKVKNGEAIYERDSVIFSKIEYSWPVLTGLLWTASLNENRLDVIDFGGSLGSSYFQNRNFLAHVQGLKWSIVEQEKFVECGKKYFEDDQLKFYRSIEESLKSGRANVLLISSTIQYIEDPYSLLDEILKNKFDVIIFDRTTFIQGKDRLTVQKVPPRIYDASYPAWFLNKEKFLGKFKKDYNLITEFDSLGGEIQIGKGANKDTAFEQGMIFARIIPLR